jgi:hypothetical protein
MISVGACGSTIIENEFTNGPAPDLGAPVIGQVSQLSNGTFEIDTGSETFILPAATTTLNGQSSWLFGNNPSIRGGTYTSSSVLAVGGVNDGRAFGAITGTQMAPPVMNINYAGRITLVDATGAAELPISLVFDSNAGTLDASGASLSGTSYTVAGTVSGNDIGGSVTYNGNTAPLDGGFYGTNEAVGTFASDEIGGLFFGVAQP